MADIIEPVDAPASEAARPPRSAWFAAPPSSSSSPSSRSSFARSARARVELLVTKRSRWPVGAQACDRLHRPRDRLARDVKDAVDVQQNGGHGAVMLSGAEKFPFHSPVAEIELRFSRSSGPGGPAREHGRDAGRGDPRRRGVVRARLECAEAAGGRERRDRRCVRSHRTSAASCATRELAVERLKNQLREALKVRRRRVATKPIQGIARAPAGVEEAALDIRSGSAAGRRKTSAGTGVDDRPPVLSAKQDAAVGTAPARARRRDRLARCRRRHPRPSRHRCRGSACHRRETTAGRLRRRGRAPKSPTCCGDHVDPAGADLDRRLQRRRSPEIEPEQVGASNGRSRARPTRPTRSARARRRDGRQLPASS